ncbi:hypothetical protein CPB84DRAFT_1834546 [Gymnopilus junonius]|uniref:SET domain-containing protein n=1 Tax=Gymnopilus junonius TaxID=109634 RepID=A0A9P5NXU3_GYMJU|nr:hypothetical protein CPB84DRAFT_1834546 [Gymnopilus junonius]
MPSQAERKRARTRTKPNVARKVKSSSFSWEAVAFAILIAAASSTYYYFNYSKISLLPVSSESTEQDFKEDVPRTPWEPTPDNSIFNVVDIPGKGKGVIAGRDIKQGELVLRDRPLFILPRAINGSPIEPIIEKLTQLTPEEQEAFFELSFVNFPTHLNPEEHPAEVALAIFQTNAVSTGDGVGIFPTMARLNHGCSSAFNVVYMWRPEENQIVVHALKDVKQGEELITTYTNTRRPRDQRRAFLQDHYGFHCTCAVCSLPDDLSKASDERLSKISYLYEKFAGWGRQEIDGTQAIEYIREIWRIENEEGYTSERGSLSADAAWIAAAHSDANATQAWAEKAIHWFTAEIGADTPQVVTLEVIVDHPQRHRAWGTRDAMDVGGPDQASGESGFNLSK